MESINKPTALKMLTNDEVNSKSVSCNCHEIISVLFKQLESLREENKRIIELENTTNQLQDQNERLLLENNNFKRLQDDIVFFKLKNEQLRSQHITSTNNSDYLVSLEEQLKMSTEDFVKENQEKKKLQMKVVDLENKLLKFKIKSRSRKQSGDKTADKSLKKFENDKIDCINKDSPNGKITKILALVERGHSLISDEDEYLECPSCHKSFSISNHLVFIDHVDSC